jgi:hypothetical protein
LLDRSSRWKAKQRAIGRKRANLAAAFPDKPIGKGRRNARMRQARLAACTTRICANQRRGEIDERKVSSSLSEVPVDEVDAEECGDDDGEAAVDDHPAHKTHNPGNHPR